mmetsp:Transcript_89237/g.207658  ORF Transcript_89237/g.207658 Transcript_89237/m.207658 type:complete len:264 (+) Transcript_89237:126-917(+)
MIRAPCPAQPCSSVDGAFVGTADTALPLSSTGEALPSSFAGATLPSSSPDAVLSPPSSPDAALPSSSSADATLLPSSALVKKSAWRKPAASMSSRVAMSSSSNWPQTRAKTLLRASSLASSVSPLNSNFGRSPFTGNPERREFRKGPSTTGTVNTLRMCMWKGSPETLKAKRASPSHWKKTPLPFSPVKVKNKSLLLSVCKTGPGFFSNDLNFHRYMSKSPSLKRTGSRAPMADRPKRSRTLALSAPCRRCACQLMLRKPTSR